MRVLLYGRLADAIDRQVELDAPGGSSVAELRRRLAEVHPAAADTLARSRTVIGGALAGDAQILDPDDTIEFLPPVSGG